MSIFVLAIFNTHEEGLGKNSIEGAFATLDAAQALARRDDLGPVYWSSHPQASVPTWTLYRDHATSWRIEEHKVLGQDSP